MNNYITNWNIFQVFQLNIIEFEIFDKIGYKMMNNLLKSRTNVIKILKRIDTFIYKFGNKIL
jgi:hypothetical protein